MDKLGNLITLREASKISGYNIDYLGFLIRTGKMNGRKMGRNWMTTADDVKYYLEHFAVLPKVIKKPVTFRISILVIFVSLIATFGAYYAYLIIYDKAYEQVVSKVKPDEDVSKQLDQKVEKNLR
jgi:hypothetical protein